MEIFIQISLILGLATVIAVIMQKLRLPLILGHILTGILVGPAFLNLIKSAETLEIFSHLGVTALLFIVGLSLSPRVIREVGKVSLITGIGQIVFTSLIGFFISRLLGYTIETSIFIAIALTFSSTIIVLKLLSDRHDLGKLYGKIAIGFLLVQDVAATIILIFVSSISEGMSPTDTFITITSKTVIIFVLLAFMSMYILPWLTKMFAKSQEFLFLFAIGWGVGMAAVFHLIGLSIEIGALAAGATLAASPYHYEISSKMKMLRDFFIIMFFVLLGSQLTVGNINSLMSQSLFFSAFVLIGNPLIVMILMGLLGYTKKTSFYAGLTVAQISEFSFILILLAYNSNLVTHEVVSLITIIGIITITGSTLMIIYADHIYKLLEPILGIFELKNPIKEKSQKPNYDAILFGCHRVGTDFLSTLKKLKRKFLVVDFDPSVINDLKSKRIPNRYGDAHDNEFLEEINIDKANTVIVTLPDFDTNLLILNKIRKTNPNSTVINIAHTVDQANLLYQLGSSYVILPHFLGGNYAAMLLEKNGENNKKIAQERKRHIEHLSYR
ncbi:cation:proton antiporter [Patescibacteria group bacterium]|nr:cation:proton antiporter [Patescibacteria group bacterium]